MAKKPPEIVLKSPFTCGRCAWTDPHGHMGKLAIAIDDLAPRGGLIMVSIGEGRSRVIEIMTVPELVAHLSDKFGPEFLKMMVDQSGQALRDKDDRP